MRYKEEAHDYRYFPCPDIPPVLINEKVLKQLNTNCQEVPIDKSPDTTAGL